MIELMRTRRFAGGVAAIALTAAASHAFAQTAPAAAEDAEGEMITLEEIIVTAQKRAQSLQDVPVSVATLSGEKLDVLNSAGSDIRFLAARVPSLNIESSFGRTFPRFYIRGLGNTDFDLNASQPVSLVVDEVVQENPILKGFPVFDVDRIEVLRGPQGTLFGRNTPAGIVKLESRRPTMDFEAYSKFTYGRFNTIEFEGAVSGPIIDDILAMRVSLRHQHRDDWIDNEAPGLQDDDQQIGGFDDFAGRVQLLYTPNDRLTANLNFHARNLDGTARVFRANIIEPGGGLVDGFERDTVFHDGENNQELDTLGFVADIEYRFDAVTVTSVTGYEHGEVFSRGDIDGGFGAVFAPPSGPGVIPFTAESADAIPELDQFTQELRIATNDWGRFDFQAGFFYFDEDLAIESFNFDTLAGGVINGFAEQRQEAQSWAIFATADFDVTDDLNVQAGVRYSEDDKDFTASRTLSPISFLPFVEDEIGPIEANPEDEVVAWDVSATYTLTPDINVYARIAKSFRAPSIQGRLLFGDVVTVADTEEILSYEAGIKSELFRRLRVNLTGYYYELEDQQLTAVGGGQNFNQLVNADETVGAGFEADMEWAATDALLLTAGVSYNFTEIQDSSLRIQICGAPCTVLDPTVTEATGTFALIDGNSLPQAPRWIANWTARYGVPLGAGELYAYTDWAYSSEETFLLYESAEFQSGALLEGGLRVGYNWGAGQYDVAAFGRNITNETELQGGIDFNNLTGFVNEPPLWGIELQARF